MEVQEAGLGLIGWFIVFMGISVVVGLIKGTGKKSSDDDKPTEEK